MIKNASTVFIGTLIGQVLPLMAAPILTRYARPDQFAVFALLLTLVAFLGIACGGRYESAIVVPEFEDEAVSLLKLSLLINLIVFACGLLAVLLALALIPRGEVFGPAWLSLPFLVLSYGLIMVWENWANRQVNYKGIAYARATRGIAVAACQVALLVFGMAPLMALVTGQAVGMFSSFAIGVIADRSFVARMRQPWDRAALRRAAANYSSYPKYNMWHGLVHAAQAPLTLAIIGAYTSQSAVGAFGLVQRLLQAPSGLVGSAVAPVLLRQLVQQGTGVARRQAVTKTLIALSVIAVPLFGLVHFWGKQLFVFVFGPDWGLAGEIAQSYSPYLMLCFIAAPVAVVGQAAKKMHQAMYASIAGNALFIVMLIATLSSGRDLAPSLLIISLAFAVYYAAYLAWVIRISRFEVAYG